VPGVATGRERGGGRAGGSYGLDAAQSNQNMLLLHILDFLSGFQGTRALGIQFSVICNENDTYNNIFSSRMLKTK
jgi:hypothetical protein